MREQSLGALLRRADDRPRSLAGLLCRLSDPAHVLRRLKEIVRSKCEYAHTTPEHLLGKVRRAIELEQTNPGGPTA